MEHNFDESNPAQTFSEESTLISTERGWLRILGRKDDFLSGGLTLLQGRPNELGCQVQKTTPI